MGDMERGGVKNLKKEVTYFSVWFFWVQKGYLVTRKHTTIVWGMPLFWDLKSQDIQSFYHMNRNSILRIIPGLEQVSLIRYLLAIVYYMAYPI